MAFYEKEGVGQIEVWLMLLAPCILLDEARRLDSCRREVSHRRSAEA
jgi:hypothetical protein